MSTQEYKRITRIANKATLGVGFEIQLQNNEYIIRQVLPGTPAARMGIKVGDRLTHIDGRQIPPFTSPEAILSKMQGQSGTHVHLGINNCFVSVKRAPLKVPSVVCSVQRDILYLKIRFFTPNAHKAIYKVIRSNQPKKIILDLRANSGGDLEAAVKATSLFISGVPIVHVKSRVPEYNKTYRAEDRAPFEKIPLVVWVDKNTASAAEVMVAAIEDYKRGQIVGGKTFGKGCVQDFFDLPYGYGGMKLTVGYCYSPKGRPLHRFKSQGLMNCRNEP